MQENEFEYVVCKRAAILSWPQCVNSFFNTEDEPQTQSIQPMDPGLKFGQ